MKQSMWVTVVYIVRIMCLHNANYTFTLRALQSLHSQTHSHTDDRNYSITITPFMIEPLGSVWGSESNPPITLMTSWKA